MSSAKRGRGPGGSGPHGRPGRVDAGGVARDKFSERSPSGSSPPGGRRWEQPTYSRASSRGSRHRSPKPTARTAGPPPRGLWAGAATSGRGTLLTGQQLAPGRELLGVSLTLTTQQQQ